MPDVAAALKFQKKMVGIETIYLKQIDEYRRQTRRALLEIVDRSGVSRPAVAAMQKEIDVMAKAVSNLAGVASGEVKKTVVNYTTKQIEVAKKVGLVDTVNIAPIVAAGAPVVKDLIESTMTNESAWVSQLQTSLQVQAAKLRIADASPEEITNRLLSETLADGRSSVWAAASNAAQTEETTNLWNMAGGLMGAYIFLFNETEPDVNYQKQAIATIDERTTDCCLKVHGQIQNIDDPFILTGTPRFADEMQDPAFHWYAIVAGEMCVTDKGNVPIENIKIGDKVLTHKGRYKPVTMTLTRVYTGEGLLIETDRGEIKITPEHPVLTIRGWVKAGELLNGDVILGLKQVEEFSDTVSPHVHGSGVSLNPYGFYSVLFEKYIPKIVVDLFGSMSPAVKLKAYFDFWKVEVKNVFTKWLLKLKVFVKNETAILEKFKEVFFSDSWFRFPFISQANGFFFSDPLHLHRVLGFHSSGSGGVFDANTGMNKSFPSSLSGGKQPSMFNPILSQDAFDHISGNTKSLSNTPLRITSSIFLDNKPIVNTIISLWHDNLLYSYYTVKSVNALVLKDTIICDLSVQDDESYCIADHFVHNCRTSEVLYQEAFEQIGIPTSEMEDAAAAELVAREDGSRVKIYPSHATARRPGN